MSQIKLVISVFISIILFSCTGEHEEKDTLIPEIEEVQVPNEEYASYRYDSTLQTEILIYQYDYVCIDQDEIMDTICFIGNGGAHQYFHLQIKLTSQADSIYEFPSLMIDIPYPDYDEEIPIIEEDYPQFLIDDFDEDGDYEIYLNVDNPFGSLSEELKSKGLSSKRMIIDFDQNGLTFSDYTE